MLIALAGLPQAMRTTVAPGAGPLLLRVALEAVIIGGLGSFRARSPGALLLGVTQQIGCRIDPGWGLWLGPIVFLMVLVLQDPAVRPLNHRSHKMLRDSPLCACFLANDLARVHREGMASSSVQSWSSGLPFDDADASGSYTVAEADGASRDRGAMRCV